MIETSNASHGHRARLGGAADAAGARPRNAFMIGTTVPTVIPTGDTQFNRQQDQTNASLISLGGGTRRGNNYTLDGVPITDMRNRASRQPDDRGARGREGAGAHLRRGDGRAPAAACSTRR